MYLSETNTLFYELISSSTEFHPCFINSSYECYEGIKFIYMLTEIHKVFLTESYKIEQIKIQTSFNRSIQETQHAFCSLYERFMSVSYIVIADPLSVRGNFEDPYMIQQSEVQYT